MKSIKAYLKEAVEAGASDVHIVGGEKPMMRVSGELQDMNTTVLASKECETQILGLLSPAQKKQFAEALELDISYEQDDHRFRINIYQQEGMMALAARVIPKEIPSLDDIALEEPIRQFTQLLDGLVLIVGPTGSGKSTTIASLIEEINKTRKSHIVTIEDPIEFLFEDKESLIAQREVGSDTHSFADALKHVLRQDPNIIFVGEMRDPETIATVLTAAETGHLVFSTLHTSTAAEAIERIVDVFDGPKQKQILIQLAAVLRGVVAQQLIPSKNGTRVAAREILINTPAVSNLVRENTIAQLQNVIETNAKYGMISMDKAMEKLYKEDLIDKETFEHRSGKQRVI